MARTRPTTTGITDTIYSDFKTGFSVHPVKGDLTLNKNEDAVKRSIRNILLTDFYERPFQPTFGGNIRRLLFENFTSSTVAVAKEIISKAIQNHEPRANLIDVIVSGTPESHQLNIKVIFSVSSRTEADVVDVVLERVR